MSHTAADRDELAQNLSDAVGEAETLLKNAAQAGSAELDSRLKKVSAQLKRAKEEFVRLEEEALLRAKEAARVADGAVHDHPYVAIGVAAGVGFLLGLLISRR